jgi:hypothetical protein
MNWIKQSEQEPTEDDLPFITYMSDFGADQFELWEDSDWFQELSESERLEWEQWAPVKAPAENSLLDKWV